MAPDARACGFCRSDWHAWTCADLEVALPDISMQAVCGAQAVLSSCQPGSFARAIVGLSANIMPVVTGSCAYVVIEAPPELPSDAVYPGQQAMDSTRGGTRRRYPARHYFHCVTLDEPNAERAPFDGLAPPGVAGITDFAA
ncbi:MAG: hypothetical protein AAF601_11085 [Pseudomonadota bacterium]